MSYLATINVPGYLPDNVDDDSAAVFDTAAEAWQYLADERARAEDDSPEWADHECDFPGDCDYSETFGELAHRARWAGSGLVCDFETVGTVLGPMPGYRGIYGRDCAYTVSEVTE